MSETSPTLQEISRRARYLIENRSTDGWASSGAGYYRHSTIGKVFVQDSAGILSVHLVWGPTPAASEVYRERDGEYVPRVRNLDWEHATLLEMRRQMVLEDLADV